MSWRLEHKIACQQIKVSSPVCGPNKNGTTSLESRKGHIGLKLLYLAGIVYYLLITKMLLIFLDSQLTITLNFVSAST
jgi:hypothetical protein